LRVGDQIAWYSEPGGTPLPERIAYNRRGRLLPAFFSYGGRHGLRHQEKEVGGSFW
jgi:hypothetical protein